MGTRLHSRHLRTPFVAGLAAALVTCLVAAALVVGPAAVHQAPAEAGPGGGGSAQVLVEYPAYGPNEIVYASGNITYFDSCTFSTGRRDYFQPFADIYVIAGTPADGGQLSDVSGAPNTVFGTIGGGFVYEILALTAEGGNLGAGTYTVVVDECQDGKYNSDEDTFFVNAFSVQLETQLRGLGEVNGFAAMKADATDRQKLSADAFRSLSTALALEDAYSTYGRFNLVSPIGALQGWIMFAFTEAIAVKFPGSADPKKGGLAALLSTHSHWKGLAADPPNPDFQRPDIASAGLPATSKSLTDAGTALLAATDEFRIEGALVEALVDAMERYQGARDVGADDWGLVHLRSAQRLAGLLSTQMETSADALDASVTAMQSGPNLSLIYAEFLAQLRSARGDAAAVNLSPAQRQAILNLGVDTDEFELFKQYLTGLDPAFARFPAQRDDLTAFATETRASATIMATYATDLAALVTTTEGLSSVDLDWVEADAGGPYTVTPGQALVLDASGSVGTGLSYSWDVDGDGVFGDITGVSPSATAFSTSDASYLVAVEVTDTNGKIDVDHALVETSNVTLPDVMVVSPAPVAALTGFSRVVELNPGTTQAFELSTTDAGDTVEWFLDDLAPSSGLTFSLTAGNDVRSHELVAVVTGVNGQSRYLRFSVFVIGTDGDGDGWLANPGPDCDDTLNTVHPARIEIVNNGIDDDCNPGTSDSGDAPFIQGAASGGQAPGTISAKWAGRLQEGDQISLLLHWSHAQRSSGTAFPYTIDFGDGTPLVSDVLQGTTAAETDLRIEHTTTKSGFLTMTVCITAPGPNTTCRDLVYTVLQSEPVIHPSDPTTWTEAYVGDAPGASVASPFPLWTYPPAGVAVTQEANVNWPALLISPFDLPDGGRISFDAIPEKGLLNDDDIWGFALGLQDDEILAPDGDWITVAWNNVAGASYESCDGPSGNSDPVAISVSRVNGLGNRLEYQSRRTFSGVPDPDLTCNDVQGLTELGLIVLPQEVTGSPAPGAWSFRIADELESPGRKAELYHFDVEYSSSRLQVWVDGFLVFDVLATNVGDGSPFPMGKVAVTNHSQASTRYQTHAPVPELFVVEGTELSVSAQVADGGVTDVLEGYFDWNDGTIGTPAVVTNMSIGWYTATAPHTYPDNGHFDADLCIDDTTDDVQTCKPIGVTVSNAIPVVDVGPDRPAPAVLDLVVSFTDAGIYDTHTATIDWGDGDTTPSAVVQQGQGYGRVEASHIYTANGPFTVQVCVTDDDGGVGCDGVETKLFERYGVKTERSVT